jgi:hypothetical protein
MHEVEALVDIRRFPASRKHPHFNRDNLATDLPKSGMEYHWLEALGGRRHNQRDESPNLGLENKGFRNYADYMLTEEFGEGVKKLREIARQKRTAIMCAEGLFCVLRDHRDEGLRRFRDAVARTWRKWLTRRSWSGTFTWARFTALLERFPLPRDVAPQEGQGEMTTAKVCQ